MKKIKNSNNKEWVQKMIKVIRQVIIIIIIMKMIQTMIHKRNYSQKQAVYVAKKKQSVIKKLR